MKAPARWNEEALFWPFSLWCRNRAHVSATTGWRWRKAGLLQVVYINGRPFVTPQAEARFMEAAGVMPADQE